jgi:serine/threonine-protein kinase
VAGLSHPNIALQEVGLHEGRLFLVSDLGSMESLETRLREDPSLAERLRWVDGIASALSYAHEQGVLHRALKPSNLLVSPEGECLLANFGLASSPTSLGASGRDYGAPEVLEGAADSAQSDIYSAGVVFYEVLSGSGSGMSGGAPPRPLREVRPDIPKDLADAVMACRERSPDWRPKDLTYLLEVVHKARGSAGPIRRPASAPRAALPSPVPTRGSRPSRGAERRSPLPILLGTALLVAAGLGAWFVMRPPTDRGPSMPPATATPTTMASLNAPSPAGPSPIAPSRMPAPGIPPGAEEPPSTVTSPSPGTVASPTATPAPTPEAPPTTRLLPPSSTPPPPTPPPTTTLGAQAETPAPLPTPDLSVPAIVTALSPPTLKRGARTLVDVRGTGLRPDMRATFRRGRSDAEGLRVVGKRFVDPTLLQLFIEVDAAEATGGHSLLLEDEFGETAAVRFDVK